MPAMVFRLKGGNTGAASCSRDKCVNLIDHYLHVPAGTMSLLGWLGSSGAPPRISQRSLSPIKPAKPSRTVLGVLGTRSNVRVEDLEAQVLGPAMEAWGIPDALILPAEGDSSYAIQAWAQVKEIPVHLVAADWTKQGPRASLLRDATIQREATHLVLLQGPRSNKLTALALRLHRRGRPVVISERPGLPVLVPEKSHAKLENAQAQQPSSQSQTS